MTLSEMLLPEFDQEMASTRKSIERVPDDKLDWQPHAKSTTMRALISHLANMPTWVGHALNEASLDVAPQGVPVRTAPVSSTREAVETFDRNVAGARAAIAKADDAAFAETWSLLQNGRTLFTMPKRVVVRSFVLNHMIHHRAQLGVYLRLNDVPVPSVYGPSADENM
ncbi:MAG: DinB family protein [Pyrinomonadaceae bacterium]